jgi:hypothetical protein
VSLPANHRHLALTHLVGNTRAFLLQLGDSQQELELLHERGLDPLVAIMAAAEAALKQVDRLGTAALKVKS